MTLPRIFFSAIAALACVSAAVAAGPLQLTLGGREILFGETSPDHLEVSKHCLPTKDCQALKALRKATTVGLNPTKGAYPGALICRNIGGQVLSGTDSRRNEVSVCAFKDGSMILNSSVYAKALANDSKR